MSDGRGGVRKSPAWLQQYDLLGKIGEGTYGLVFLARIKQRNKCCIAIKKFKQSKDGDGVSPTAIREIMLLREISHENVVKLVNVHINHADMSLYLAFDYAEHDLRSSDITEKSSTTQSVYTQLSHYYGNCLMGLTIFIGNDPHDHGRPLGLIFCNWIIHRDLKPSNILVMGDGEEHGIVKIGDFGLARIYLAPLKPLCDNGVVVTIWYRAPELLLGAKHYTSAVDMWAVGCIFAELLTLKPLFQGVEVKAATNPFQLDQLDKIFKVLGHPTQEKWSTLVNLPFWQNDQQHIQGRKYDSPGLHSYVHLPPKSAAYDLLSKMLEYDPRKRLTAAQALEHEYFRIDPLPGRNALVPSQPGEKTVNYPNRPVDANTDFEGTTNIHPHHQVPSGNAMSGNVAGGAMVGGRGGPRPMQHNMVGMQQRMAAANMALNMNMTSQAAGGMPGALNPGALPMQRGNIAQAQQQQQQLRRKDQGMQNQGYPQQKRRF